MDDFVDVSALEGMSDSVIVEEEMGTERDWSKLLPELVELIAENVVTISDYIRFRSVCMSWRKAVAPCNLRPQPPIILLPYDVFNPNRYFFSIATGRAHHISLPQLVGKRILATTNGWMLLIDVQTQELSLHNPVSLAYIDLPPSGDFGETIDSGRLFYDQCVDNFVVLIYLQSEDAGSWFCKVGDGLWSVLKINFDNPFYLIYHKGKFIANEMGFIYIDDVSAASSGRVLPAGSIKDIPEFSIYSYNFFVTANGQLFLFLDNEDKGFVLYKIDSDGHQIKWSKVQFENYAIFISDSQSIMFCVKNFPKYNENCYYSPEHNGKEQLLCIMDCEDGTYDFVPCGWERPADFNEELLWITPSFH